VIYNSQILFWEIVQILTNIKIKQALSQSLKNCLILQPTKVFFEKHQGLNILILRLFVIILAADSRLYRILTPKSFIE
jgi:hypothetical protein